MCNEELKFNLDGEAERKGTEGETRRPTILKIHAIQGSSLGMNQEHTHTNTPHILTHTHAPTPAHLKKQIL